MWPAYTCNIDLWKGYLLVKDNVQLIMDFIARGQTECEVSSENQYFPYVTCYLDV